MKKLLCGVIASFCLAAPALAQETVLEFQTEAGDSVTVTIASDDGIHTWDTDTNTLCADYGGAQLCSTFAENITELGGKTTFTSTTGETGTVTLKGLGEPEKAPKLAKNEMPPPQDFFPSI